MAQKRSRATFEADLRAQQSPYVSFGTPLPPLDRQTRDDGSYVPVWKQEVTDAQGRKRLHGAFTGGFSAGYFNSVGSKEGWTPQTFVSSRTNRAKAAQKAEDFMDEEDLADAEESRVLETKGGFSGFGSTADEVGGNDAFMDLFRMGGETMGVRLLKKMGWMDGQSIGSERHEVRAGKALGPGGGEETKPSITVASKMISLIRKTDTKGLGLGREQGLVGNGHKNGRTLNTFSPATKPKKPKPKRGGFGVGILKDTGSDEEDPYDVGPKLSYSRLADKRKPKKAENGIVASNSNPLLASKPVFLKKAVPVSGFRRCHDGKLPIDGFVLSTQGPVSQDKRYAAPQIPEDWQPLKQASAFPGSTETQSTADLAKASTLNPSSRAALLGETPLPGQSVFDFLSPAARDKLAAASNNPNLPAGKYEPSAEPPTGSQEPPIPTLEPQVAATALQRISTGLAPYADDPSKLARYRAFLSHHTNLIDDSSGPDNQLSSTHAELQEFASAATIFAPVSGVMAGRFTSSSAPIETNPANGTPLSSMASKPMAPEQEAARMSMHGVLTRKTLVFAPTRLLCKRFGIAAPLHVQPEPANGVVATSSGGGAARKTAGGADMLGGFVGRFTSGGVQGS